MKAFFVVLALAVVLVACEEQQGLIKAKVDRDRTPGFTGSVVIETPSTPNISSNTTVNTTSPTVNVSNTTVARENTTNASRSVNASTNITRSANITRNSTTNKSSTRNVTLSNPEPPETDEEEEPEEPSNTNLPGMSEIDLSAHANANDCWIVSQGNVYDISEWASIDSEVAEHCGSTSSYDISYGGDKSRLGSEGTIVGRLAE